MNTEQSGSVDGAQVRVKRYRCKLDTLSHVKSEMSRCYRESRSGLLDVAAAAKLVFILGQIAKCIESSDLEKRVELLEELNNVKH